MMPLTNDDMARLAIDGWAAMSTNVRLGDMPFVSAVRQSHRVEHKGYKFVCDLHDKV